MNATELPVFRGVLISFAIFLVSFSLAIAQPAEIDFHSDPFPEHYEPLRIEEQRQMAAERDEERASKRNPEYRQQTPAIDWIRLAYHGGIYDNNLDPIDFDGDVIAEMQESLFAILTDTVEVEYWEWVEGASVETLDRFLNNGYDGYDLLTYRQVLLNELVDAAPEVISVKYAWKLNLVDDQLWRLMGREQHVLRPELLQQTRKMWYFVSPGSQYIKDCRAKGVPIPPNFPDTKKWKYQGELGYTFISQINPAKQPLTAEVYAYKDTSAKTPGTCVALPRAKTSSKYSSGGDAELIGIICQGSRKVGSAQHACFWDNLEVRLDGTTGRRVNGQSRPMTIGYVADGYSLSENCTECHRGNNVFNIHPGTALDLAKAAASKGGPYAVSANWYKPIGRSSFSNPPAQKLGPAGSNQGSCEGCHSIGNLAGPFAQDPSSGYCNIIADAAHRTMPPVYFRDKTKKEGAAGWPPPPPPPGNPTPPPPPPGRYQKHIDVLSAVCKAAVVDVLR